jgi:hypothetical protein
MYFGSLIDYLPSFVYGKTKKTLIWARPSAIVAIVGCTILSVSFPSFLHLPHLTNRSQRPSTMAVRWRHQRFRHGKIYRVNHPIINDPCGNGEFDPA